MCILVRAAFLFIAVEGSGQISLLGSLFGLHNNIKQVTNNFQNAKSNVDIDIDNNVGKELEIERRVGKAKEQHKLETWSEIKFWLALIVFTTLFVGAVCLAWSCKSAILKRLNRTPAPTPQQFAMVPTI